MRKYLNKLAVVTSLVMLTSAFAAYSVGVDIETRMRAKINEGTDALAGAVTLEDTIIKAAASVDNVSAEVVFEYDGKNHNALILEDFHVTVSDLFGGMLTARFFEWSYAAGSSYDEGDYILSDYSFYGAYVTLKPIDIISLGLGYGFYDGNGSLNVVTVKAAAAVPSPAPGIPGIAAVEEEAAAAGIHAIKFALGVTGTGFPLNIYFGTLLNNASRSKDTDRAKDVEFGVNLMQVGADIKLYQDYLDLGIGITLPIGTRVTPKKPDGTDGDEEFIALIVLSGKAPILDTGLTVSYALSYATEAQTKTLKFNELTGEVIENPMSFGFTDMLRVKLGLDWSLGIITIGNEIGIVMQEVHGIEEVFNPMVISYEPSVKLSFAEGFFVKFLYNLTAEDVGNEYDVPNHEVALSHTLGMDVAAKFGVSNE